MNFNINIGDPNVNHLVTYYGSIFAISFIIAFIANIIFSKKNLNVYVKLWGSFLILCISFFTILKIIQLWNKYSNIFMG